MYIETVPNRNSPPAILLREGWREGHKTRKRTLANLSHWPAQKIETLRRLLRDETLVSPQELFTTQRTLPHGHVQAVLGIIRQLGLEAILATRRCRERDLVVAMIAQRVLDPCSKLATTRAWHATTLAQELGVTEATEDDLCYKSLSEVERAFRCLKGIELRVRPIHHRTAERVTAHIFLCLLAYYVEWHLRRAWAPILFEDEERRAEGERRDPVAPAKPSVSAQQKKSSHQTQDGLAVHSFETLMAELATRARVTYALRSGDSTPIFRQVPEPTPLQARAYDLLKLLPVAGN